MNAEYSGHRDILEYQHAAMATMFSVMIAGEDSAFAEQAAMAAFQEIDRLEQELSRYIPTSDISRINNLMPHGSACIGLDAFQCLQIASQCWTETGGAFDVTVGALKDCWIGKDRSLLHPPSEEVQRARSRTGMGLLALRELTYEVHVGELSPCVDLGAIGKGYAVDRASGLLREWGVGSALVHGGGSSVFAFGDSPEGSGWPVTLSAPGGEGAMLEKVRLRDRSLGGSGIGRGMHIIDPRSAEPVRSRRAAWVCSDSAARSDALSTACMVLTHAEIEQYCAAHPETWAMVVEVGEDGRSGAAVRFGGIKTA